jgi:SpoVK/Ycf46/Vps4 family AAA+-type ATPase
MDGLRREESVLFVGTTNTAGHLDDAFKRPGRFGVLIEVGPPTAGDRGLILEEYARRFGLDLPESERRRIVDRTDGWSGDHLRAFCQTRKLVEEWNARGGKPEWTLGTEEILSLVKSRSSRSRWAGHT